MNKLWVNGKILPIDSRAIAVVGSRLPSSKGMKLTRDFVSALVKANYTIISGLARGIDTIAHRTALDNDGRTIAVLGSGLDIIYPPENVDLANLIINNGAVVSCFPTGTRIYPKNFLARNKIIVELSKAVLVIEGARRSGTLSTAAWAADLGIDVYAIPGSSATDWLIGEGVQEVSNPEELIKFLSANN